MADDEHSVMHVLHSLHTQGRIDFTERGNGMGTATCVNIRLPKKGSKRDIVNAGIPFDQPEANGPEATTEQAPQHTPPSAPESESAGYPLLDALLDRERNRQESDNKAMAYITAADMLLGVDEEARLALLEKAAAFDVTFPSPLEQEYIRYVASHPDKA
jgi:hypothetical protein